MNVVRGLRIGSVRFCRHRLSPSNGHSEGDVYFEPRSTTGWSALYEPQLTVGSNTGIWAKAGLWSHREAFTAVSHLLNVAGWRTSARVLARLRGRLWGGRLGCRNPGTIQGDRGLHTSLLDCSPVFGGMFYRVSDSHIAPQFKSWVHLATHTSGDVVRNMASTSIAVIQSGIAKLMITVFDSPGSR